MRGKRNIAGERCVEIGNYIVETGATVRGAARKFGVSKSTVHKDVAVRLLTCDRALCLRVRDVLDKNKAERHLRGGAATRKKFRGE
jgi:Stage III sporulation protein D.